MSHWAELDKDNVVVRVLVGNNNDPDEGYQWLVDNLGGRWMQTSYNARGGKRKDPETSEPTDEAGFRKNYAGKGSIYREDLDAFVRPQPFLSWILDEETCLWNAPIEKPVGMYIWDEDTVSWKEIEQTRGFINKTYEWYNVKYATIIPKPRHYSNLYRQR